MTERYDIFLSYARRDRAEWVETLATNLHQRGFEVFLDDWEIGAGDVLVHELDRGILESRHGVLVLTRSYFDRPFVQAEYAAILQRTIEGKQRVIPVLVDDVEVPPLLASRIWVDFRDADGPGYEARFEDLVRALQGKKAKDRPPRPAAPPQTSSAGHRNVAGIGLIGHELSMGNAGLARQQCRSVKTIDAPQEAFLYKVTRSRRAYVKCILALEQIRSLIEYDHEIARPEREHTVIIKL